MMNKRFFTAATVVTLLLLLAVTAQAHRLRVFAYESGGVIHCEVEFNSGRPAKGVTVLVKNDEGAEVLRGTTDDAGGFRFPLPPDLLSDPVPLEIIADAGEGHRGSWLLETVDYAKVGAIAAPPSTPPQAQSPPTGATGPAVTAEEATPGIEACAQTEELIRSSLAAELGPIKKMLAELRQDRLTLQDILGGLGYIFGLAGIAAYFHSKKQQHRGGSQ